MSDAESSDLSSTPSNESLSNFDESNSDTDPYSDFEDSFNQDFVVPRPNFNDTVKQQNFPFHNTFMEYISKNVKSADVYQKIIQTCKYFFHKNPIFFIARLHAGYAEDISCKIWITHKIEVESGSGDERDWITLIIPKIYQSDIVKLYVWQQNFSLNNLSFLASKCKKIRLHQVIFKKNDDGTNVTLEKVVEVLPKLLDFEYNLEDIPEYFVTSETAENLLKIPHFRKLKDLTLTNIPGIFVGKNFYPFIKEIKKTIFHLEFIDTSDECNVLLQNILNKIYETEINEYKLPWIEFPEMENYNKFQEIWYKKNYKS